MKLGGIDIIELSWEQDIQPAFGFSELLNGKVVPKYDYGTSADNFFSNLTFYVPIDQKDNVQNWFIQYQGTTQTISSTNDLFLPGQYHTSGISVIPVSLSFDGKYSHNLSKHVLFTIRLFCKISFQTLLTNPSWLSNGIKQYEWETQSSFNTSLSNYNSRMFSGQGIDSFSYNFPYLTKPQMNELIRWILTKRTSDFLIDGNLYKLAEYEFENNLTSYSATLTYK